MTAVRTLLTVIVAAALLGASLPAVDDARTSRSETRLDTAAVRVGEAATALAANEDPVPVGEQGASRTLLVRLPSGSFAEARTAYLSVGGLPNASAPTTPTTLGYRVAGQPPRQREASVPLFTDAKPLVLGPGTHRLRLTLVRTHAGVGVRIRVVSPAQPTRTATASATAAPTNTPTSA